MCIMPPQNLNLAAASSVNMEDSHKSLLSAVKDFSPQPSPNPADFSDSERDEREEEEPLGFGGHTRLSRSPQLAEGQSTSSSL